jgi:hypothetical protein
MGEFIEKKCGKWAKWALKAGPPNQSLQPIADKSGSG